MDVSVKLVLNRDESQLFVLFNLSYSLLLYSRVVEKLNNKEEAELLLYHSYNVSYFLLVAGKKLI